MNTSLHKANTSVFPSLRIRPLPMLALLAALLVAFMLSLSVGSVSIPLDNVVRVLTGGAADKEVWQTIILLVRLPKAVTAVLAGAALACAGLHMQTLFRNPLADPFVLGISAGASLGVGLVVLGTGVTGVELFRRVGVFGGFGVVAAASLGAAVVFVLVMAIARVVSSPVTLLVIGLMLSYMTSALVSVLIYFSRPEQVQTFVLWTFGSFGGVTWDQMFVFAPVVILGTLAAQSLAKPLNALLMGDGYAQSMGLDVRRTQRGVIAVSAVLAGSVTAYCGPIGFLGIAVPHMARSLFNTSDHRVLLPACAFLGGALALAFDLIAQMPGARFSLPLNVVTALVGAPVVIWIILRRRRMSFEF